MLLVPSPAAALFTGGVKLHAPKSFLSLDGLSGVGIVEDGIMVWAPFPQKNNLCFVLLISGTGKAATIDAHAAQHLPSFLNTQTPRLPALVLRCSRLACC
jgi:hypothetical protein